MFQCGQYWFCNFMLRFWCFTQEVMGVYHYFKTQFQLNFGILFPPESDNLYLPGPCFNVQMWPVLALPLHFEVLMVHSAGHGGVYYYFKTQFLLNLGVLFFP